jgi:pimeloyl-ACP methyl ester carboxylesterase
MKPSRRLRRAALLVFCVTASVLFAVTSRAQDQARSHYVRDAKKDSVIVFVHGVLGDSQSTWTNITTKAYWPSLMKDDPHFRDFDIFVVSYPSDKFRSSYTVDELVDVLRRDLDGAGVFEHKQVYFLCHSMGGLVVRGYLIRYQKRAFQVPMIYFFSAPTTGAQIANLATLFSRNRQMEGLLPIDANEYLASVQKGWLAADFPIASYCAYETQDTSGIRVVTESSATSLCNKRLDPIDANHIDIVKPSDVKDVPYVAFQTALQEARSGPTKKSTSSLPSMNLPPPQKQGSVVSAPGGIVNNGGVINNPTINNPAPPQKTGLFELTEEKRNGFLKLLSAQTAPRDKVRIGCTSWSEMSCVAAGRFLLLFSEAGWQIEGNKVFRLEPQIPIVGIAIATHTPADEPKESLPPHLGRWRVMDQSHQTIYWAFRSLDIPISSSTDDSLQDATLGIYFGSEPNNPTANNIGVQGPCSINQQSGSGNEANVNCGPSPDPYAGVSNRQVSQWAMQEAARIEKLGDDCRDDVVAATKRKDQHIPFSLPDAPGPEFVQIQFRKAFDIELPDLKKLHESINFRLGPAAKDEEEKRDYDEMVNFNQPPNNSWPLCGEVEYYAQDLRRIANSLESQP